MLAGRGAGRVAVVVVVFIWVIAAFAFLGGRYNPQWYDAGKQQLDRLKEYGGSLTSNNGTSVKSAVSYNLNKPPTTGCPDIVGKLQLRLIEAYSEMLRGIRYVNLWGYLGLYIPGGHDICYSHP